MASRTSSSLVASLFAAALACIAVTSADRVCAQDNLKDSSFHDRPQMVSVFTGFFLNRYLSEGVPYMIGGRYYYPIVPNGFIPSLNDEFGIEGGLDLLFLFGDNTHFGFNIPIEAVWDFHFSPTFDAYGKLGFMFGNVFADDYYYVGGVRFGNSYGGFWFDPRFSVGLRLKVSESLYFRAEVGYPTIMAGLGFAF